MTDSLQPVSHPPNQNTILLILGVATHDFLYRRGLSERVGIMTMEFDGLTAVVYLERKWKAQQAKVAKLKANLAKVRSNLPLRACLGPRWNSVWATSP